MAVYFIAFAKFNDRPYYQRQIRNVCANQVTKCSLIQGSHLLKYEQSESVQIPVSQVINRLRSVALADNHTKPFYFSNSNDFAPNAVRGRALNCGIA